MSSIAGQPASQTPSERRLLWVPAALGVWAAAIAVAPRLELKAILAAPAALVSGLWWSLQSPLRWLALFFAAALLLPPLPIPIGDSGPHPSLLFAALGLFAGILWMNGWEFRGSSLSAAFAALFGALLVSVAPAAIYSGSIAAAGSAVRVALFGISVYVFFYGAYGPGRGADAMRSVRWLYAAAVVAALFACVDFYYQFPAPAGYGPQFVWLDSGVYRRAQGLFYEASTLGNFCAFFLVMIVAALTRPRAESPVSRKALIAGGAIFSAALMLSYSRGSLVNVAVSLVVLMWVNRRRLPLTRLVPLAAAGVFATWWIFPKFVQEYWSRLSSTAEFLFTATNGVLSGRVASWNTLADWMTTHPWQLVFGIGYKTLPYTDYLGAPVVADNMYLSLLIETGIGGLAALLWLNWAILRAAARSAERSFFGLWMLCFWCGQVVQMASGDLLTYWRVLPVYFWVLALAVRE
ncbi:MAG TPA: O-antigen ligase family protein [Bryobacteraceae bacterium]|nr:O-antigen ligase family protein [Bryobacteraceae bacterium]